MAPTMNDSDKAGGVYSAEAETTSMPEKITNEFDLLRNNS